MEESKEPTSQPVPKTASKKTLDWKRGGRTPGHKKRRGGKRIFMRYTTKSCVLTSVESLALPDDKISRGGKKEGSNCRPSRTKDFTLVPQTKKKSLWELH